MTAIEITAADFEQIGIQLKDGANCILLLTLENCNNCNRYMAELDKKNITYRFIKCNSSNMSIISKIAKQLNITSLSVPLVLKMRNGSISQICSNKIENISQL